MRITSFRIRLWILVLLLGAGFGLRLHNLTIPNLNIDETWSYINSLYLAHPVGGVTREQILMPEPNNALHLILTAMQLNVLSGAFGVRWLSVVAGILTVALAARVAYRLYGQTAALIAALIVTFAYAPVTFSQIGRPYALATLFALFSLLFWLEKRPRLNMLASMIVPLFHIGAFPVVMIQDAFTLRRVLRHQDVNKLDWIVRRIPVYAAFLLIVYLTYLRRNIHVISAGQPAPSPVDILTHAANVIVSGFPTPTLQTLLFALGVVLPLVLFTIAHWRQLPKHLDVPLLWIIATYGLLIAGAVLSDGPIKWIHISHVAIALALLLSALLAKAPRMVLTGVLSAYCIASALSLVSFYRQPDFYWSDVRAEIDSARQENEPIYLQQSTVLWSFQVNNPTATYIQLFPAPDQLPARYLYVEMTGWDPPPPPECKLDALWSNGAGLRLLECTHG